VWRPEPSSASAATRFCAQARAAARSRASGSRTGSQAARSVSCTPGEVSSVILSSGRRRFEKR